MSEPSIPIRGKVARVLNSRELALNIGTNHGVQVGMLFDVLAPNGESIRDPDTQTVLGSIERPKIRVKVTTVQERLSVAATFRTRKVNIGGAGPDVSSLSRLLLPPKIVTQYETLHTDETTWEQLDERESFVKTGDPVRQVLEESGSAAESSEAVT